MATIYQVSALAGVSLATVSRVMNKSTRVSDKTREKVLAAMAQLDYRPNSIARSLASNCTNSVGILVSELHGPFYGAMMSGIESELRILDKHAFIAAGHGDEIREKEGINFLIDRNCDALILHVEAVSDQYLIELSKGSLPFVLINRYVPEIADKCISLNNEVGGYLATKHLLDQGHLAFAYISGPLWKSDAKQRLAGHKRALGERKLTLSPSLFFEGDFRDTGGSLGIEYLLQTKQSFTAVVCANDEMAAGAMKTLREQGLLIPDDVSIIGFDNNMLSRFTYPGLATINYPIIEMGKMAAQWVLKNIYKKGKPEIKNQFLPELIIRDSVQSIRSE